jgi:hypothetical protein
MFPVLEVGEWGVSGEIVGYTFSNKADGEFQGKGYMFSNKADICFA